MLLIYCHTLSPPILLLDDAVSCARECSYILDLFFRSLYIRRRFTDNHPRCKVRTVSVSSSSSRDLDERRVSVVIVLLCWLFGVIIGTLYVTVGWYSSLHVTYAVTSFVASFVLPVTVLTIAGRDVTRMSVLVGRAVERSKRRHSSMVWLAARVTRRSSRLSDLDGERKSVSSACDVVLRDMRRSLVDEVCTNTKKPVVYL